MKTSADTAELALVADEGPSWTFRRPYGPEHRLSRSKIRTYSTQLVDQLLAAGCVSFTERLPQHLTRTVVYAPAGFRFLPEAFVPQAAWPDCMLRDVDGIVSGLVQPVQAPQ